MTRSADHPTYRRRRWGGLLAFPLVLAACDGKPSTPEPVGRSSAAATTGTVSVVPAGGLPPSSPAPAPAAPRVVSYQEAEASYTAGRFGEAKELFEGYVSSRPENPFGHYMLGLSAWKAGDLVRAESAFDRALALDSTHVRSWVNSTRVLLDLQRDHEALERANRALVLEPESSEALRLKARAQARLGDVDAARRSYREALVADDRDVWALNNLGVLELESGDPVTALKPLARAVQLRGTAPIFQNNFGMALERAGHFGAAVRAYAAAVAADSGYVKAVRNLERLRPLVGDVAVDESISTADLAEEFRLLVRSWKDSAPREVPDP